MLARWGIAGLALSITILFLMSCAEEPAQKVSLSKTKTDVGVSSQNWTCLGCKTPPHQPEYGGIDPSTHYLLSDFFRVAISSMTMPAETLSVYQQLLSYMGDKLGKRVELVQRRTYREANDLVEKKLVDVAFVCSLPYILGHEKFGMELLVAPEANGKPVYYSYIIVRADSGIDSFEHLRGKTFAFMDPDSNTGALYPTYRLTQMGETPNSFFYNYVYTYAHDNSIKAVQSRTVDGAAVDSLVFDYMAARDPTLASQIKVVEKSPAFGMPPVVVHPALDQQLKEQLRGIFLNMDQDERGKEILASMSFDRFVLVDDSAYDSIRQMYQTVQDQAKK